MYLQHRASVGRKMYGSHISSEKAGLHGAADLTLRAHNGNALVAWHIPPQNQRPLVLFLQGNAPLRCWAGRFNALTTDGTGLLAASFQGVGGSAGRPSEREWLLDAIVMYEYLTKLYSPNRLVVWGYSVGTTIAAALAAERTVSRVILEAPFPNASALLPSRWLAPLRYLVRNQLRTDKKITKLAAPLLVLHGQLDTVVPAALGRHLYDLAPSPKSLVQFSQGSHYDLDLYGAVRVARRFMRGEYAKDLVENL